MAENAVPNGLWQPIFRTVHDLRLGVDFTIILCKAFTPADTESTKKTDNWPVFCALLGSACVKAAHRMLMKLTPGGRFIHHFKQSFNTPRSQKHKNTIKPSVFFVLLGF